jgi:hypothetical protein
VGALLPVEEYTATDWLFTAAPGIFGLVPGWAYPTGVCLWVILAIMVICSMKWVRESGNFEVSRSASLPQAIPPILLSSYPPILPSSYPPILLSSYPPILLYCCNTDTALLNDFVRNSAPSPAHFSSPCGGPVALVAPVKGLWRRPFGPIAPCPCCTDKKRFPCCP